MHALGRSRGQLSVEASLPRAFNLSTSEPRMTSVIPVRIRFFPQDDIASKVEPYYWTFSVKSKLQLRSLCSVQKLLEEPTPSEVKSSSFISSHSQTITSEKRYYENLVWR